MQSKTQNSTPIKKLKTKHYSLGTINEYTKEVQLVNCTNKKQAVYNSQGIGMLEDTQNNLSAPNIQTSSGIGIKIFILNTCALLKCISTIFVIEKWLIHLKKNKVVLNQKLDKILENQEFIKVHIHSAKHDEIPLGNDFLEVYQKFIPIKCKQDLIEIENLLTNEFTFKVNLGERMFGYSGEDVGRFIKQVLYSTFSAYFSTKISYTANAIIKRHPTQKKLL
ncbi:hypothetical protein ACI65C_006391 [Semiaphis heraclei]